MTSSVKNNKRVIKITAACKSFPRHPHESEFSQYFLFHMEIFNTIKSKSLKFPKFIILFNKFLFRKMKFNVALLKELLHIRLIFLSINRFYINYNSLKHSEDSNI